ncbi:uncharacterized protein METZ01_LOCUS393274, partial [marine metagenome]
MKHFTSPVILFLFFSFAFPQTKLGKDIDGAAEQDLEKKDTLRYIFEPDSLFLRVGETEEVTIKMVNSDGSMAGAPFLIYGQPRRSLEASLRISDSTGYAKVKVKPYKSGSLKLQVRSISIKRGDRIYGSVKVTVPKPKLKRIVFKDS